VGDSTGREAEERGLGDAVLLGCIWELGFGDGGVCVQARYFVSYSLHAWRTLHCLDESRREGEDQ